MKRLLKAILWLILGIIGTYIATVVFFFLRPTNARDNRSPESQKQMKAITLEWARLAPFPEEAEDFIIYTEGNTFTRTFKGSFTASEETIKQWVRRSPGLQEAKIESISDTEKKYIISPGGGASYAEVTINYQAGKVVFKAAWG